MLFFRGQDITRADHVAFARCFGELEDHPVVGSDPEHPGLVRIYRSDNRHSYENVYHCDGLWRQNPAMGAVLRCIECPEIGGDTIWVNMVQAYEELPEEIKQKIAKLRAKASIEHFVRRRHVAGGPRQAGPDNPPAEHPVVRTHPETGEKVLYVGSFSTHFVELQHARERAPRHRQDAGRIAAAELPAQPGQHSRVPGALVLAARATWWSGTTAARSTTR